MVSIKGAWSEVVLTVLALTLISGPSCARKRPTAELAGERTFSIKTWTRKDCSATPWAVAQREGFLADEHVAVQWTNEIQPALQIPSILRGDNDVAVLRPDTLAVAKAAGARSLPGRSRHRSDHPGVDARFRHLWRLCILPSIRISIALRISPTCRTPFGSRRSLPISGPTWKPERLAERYGFPGSKFEWVTMPGLQAVQALKQGSVDVSEIDSAFFKAMADAGARKIADSSETNLGAAGGITYYVFRDEVHRAARRWKCRIHSRDDTGAEVGQRPSNRRSTGYGGGPWSVAFRQSLLFDEPQG